MFERKIWVQILHRVLDMIRSLSKQNLSFRGHVETIKPEDTFNNYGNFIELTKLFQTMILCCWNMLFGARIILKVNIVTYRHEFKMNL